MKKSKCNISAEKELEIGRLYKEGASYSDLMVQFNTSKSFVCKLIKKLGLNNLDRTGVMREKKKGKPAYNRLFSLEEENQIIQEYLETPVSARDLARKIGINDCTILRMLKRHNIPQKDKDEIMRIRELKDYRIRTISLKKEPKIGDLYLNGLSQGELAEKFHVPKPTISGCIRRLGLKDLDRDQTFIRRARETGPDRRRFGEALEKRISGFYLEGKSIAELAEQYNVSKNCIKAVLCRQNVPRRNQSESLKNFHATHEISSKVLNKQQEKEIVESYSKNISAEELAKKYDVCNQTIAKCVQRYGIKLRTHAEAQELKDVDGEKNPNFRGLGKYAEDGTWLNYGSHGYLRRVVKDHPLAHADGTIGEHVYQACLKFGVDKVRGMHVHHINGLKEDNRPENLTILTPEEHIALHHKLHGNVHAEHLMDHDFDQ